MNMKKIVGWLVVIGILWFIATNTGQASDLAHQILGGLKQLGNGLATFFSSL